MTDESVLNTVRLTLNLYSQLSERQQALAANLDAIDQAAGLLEPQDFSSPDFESNRVLYAKAWACFTQIARSYVDDLKRRYAASGG